MESDKPLNPADLLPQIKHCQPFLFCASCWMALAEGQRAEWHLEKELLLAGTELRAAVSLVSRVAAHGWALLFVFGQSCFAAKRSSQTCLWFGCWGQKEGGVSYSAESLCPLKPGQQNPSPVHSFPVVKLHVLNVLPPLPWGPWNWAPFGFFLEKTPMVFIFFFSFSFFITN